MNKSKLVDSIAKDTNMKKREVEAVLESFLKTVMNTVASGEKVQLTGFGSFERKERKERVVRVPNTKKEVVVPASMAATFSAGSIFKEKVNS